MANYVLIISLALFVIISNGNALSCYFCTNNYGTNCIKPNVTTTRCHLHNDALNNQLTQLYGENHVKTPYKSSEHIKCLHYERFLLLENRTEIYRGCIHVKYASDYCQTHKLDQRYFPFNLTKCTLCGKDFCNSSKNVRSNVGFVSVLSILSAVFLYSL